MILEDVKPLMILYMPIVLPAIGSVNVMDFKQQGSSWMGATVDMLVRNTTNDNPVGGYVPIPFYFFERLGNSKDGGDDETGFLLDGVEEDISIERPDAASTTENGVRAGQAQKPIKTITVINTMDIMFRVKMGSTLITLLRALWKRSITDLDVAKNTRFDFFWQSYIMSGASLTDYNESNITGTDLVQIKIKLKKEYSSTSSLTDATEQVTVAEPPVYDVPIRG